MSEVKLISPLLDNFIVGNVISEHNGVRCYPAMKNDSDTRYILKVISIPASSVQLDALLLTGAYASAEDATKYFAQLAKDVEGELKILNRLAKLEGFFTYEGCQIEVNEETSGYDVYLLGQYKRSLERQFRKLPMTHLAAVNLGLDICASLTVCRQAGYLYADLKPGNIFLTEDNEYRIGDLGFLPIIGLKYASLPDRYRSSYTAPELSDPFSPISVSMDIYAAGLILYQAYNGGVLPFEGSAPAEALPAPLYADYEMSDIILKACAPDPADRWEDPIKMGQALVGYMQRNGVDDEPIIPPSASIDSPDETEPEPFEEESEVEEDFLYEQADEAGQMMIEQMLDFDQPTEEDMQTEETPEEETEDIDDLTNLSFLDDLNTDETVPQEENAEDVVYEELTEDGCDILEQADDLIAHETPGPVVAPDPVDVPMPEPIVSEVEETEPEEETDHVENTVAAIDEALAAEDAPIAPAEEPADAEVVPAKTEDDPYAPFDEKKAKKNWGNRLLAALLVLILLACLTVAGYLFYRDYYIKVIDEIQVSGVDNTLTVSISTQADHKLLNVVCTDTYGNKVTAPVENGFATFTDLTPDMLYTITVDIEGFHGVKGDIRTTYTTAPQTEIVTFQAVTGAEPGTVILSFTTKGHDYNEWTVTYEAEDQPALVQTFSGHMTSISGLEVGKTYAMTLDAAGNGFVIGQTQLEYKATDLIYPANVDITAFTEEALSVAWDDPEGIDIPQWTVLCYNDSGYSQTVVTEENTAQFTAIDTSASYTVEVTAAGMSVGSRFYISKNAVIISSFAATPVRGGLNISWQFDGAQPTSEWVLSYIPEGIRTESMATINGTTGRIEGVVPGVKYTIRLQLKDGSTVIAGTHTVDVPEAQPFDGYGITPDAMIWQMCLAPNDPDWIWWSVNNFQTSFKAGQKAGFVARLTNRYGVSGDLINTVYAIRDAEGKLVSVHSNEESWSNMWYQYYGEFNAPTLPQTPGDYTMDIYFNGASVHHQAFTIVE